MVNGYRGFSTRYFVIRLVKLLPFRVKFKSKIIFVESLIATTSKECGFFDIFIRFVNACDLKNLIPLQCILQLT